MVKFFITGAILYLLAAKIDFAEVIDLVSRLRMTPLVLSVLLTVGAVILSAYKWQLLLAARGWKVSMGLLTKYYFVGLFMNNFLPSSIGGDLMRIYQVGKRIGSGSEAAASVVLERLLATIGLVLPAAAAVLPNRVLLGEFVVPLLYFFIICLIMTFIAANPALVKPLTKIPGKGWQKTVAKLREINEVIQSYRSKPVIILRVILFSVIFQMMIVCINYLLIKAMGIGHISIWHCTLMVPVISAVSMLPISINGLGVREAAYVLLFAKIGMSAGQAVTLSLLFFLIVTVVSLVGGILFVMEREKEDYVVAG